MSPCAPSSIRVLLSYQTSVPRLVRNFKQILILKLSRSERNAQDERLGILTATAHHPEQL